jgi:hypothetical protein
MACIIVLNPIILGSATDKFGDRLSFAELTLQRSLARARGAAVGHRRGLHAVLLPRPDPTLDRILTSVGPTFEQAVQLILC